MSAQQSSSLPLSGQIALVTGASRSIGAAIALELADQGATVAIGYAGSEEKAKGVRDQIIAKGGKAEIFQADLREPKKAGDQVRAVHAHFGRLDILVNNAGVFYFGNSQVLSEENYGDMWNVNVHSPYEAVKAAGPLFQSGARIISIGSSAARISNFADGMVYGSTKAALENLNRGWAREFGPRGITSNVVAPGPIESEGAPAPGTEFHDKLREGTALKKWGVGADVAKLVAFLASPVSGNVTGAVFHTDAGSLA